MKLESVVLFMWQMEYFLVEGECVGGCWWMWQRNGNMIFISVFITNCLGWSGVEIDEGVGRDLWTSLENSKQSS